MTSKSMETVDPSGQRGAPSSQARKAGRSPSSSALRTNVLITQVCAVPVQEYKGIQPILKRAMDVAGSGFGLLMLLPLFLVVAFIIRFTSPGPIFFYQTRIGKGGKPFKMVKFRSMVINAEALKAQLASQNESGGQVAFKMARDPRITPIGRFIRKFSIDELPQLWNVFRGDMSLVGPRPPVPSEVAKYTAHQRRRLSVTPGLTCIWQVSGRSRIGFDEWVLLDIRYIEEWSLWLDITILFKTLPAVLSGDGAY